LFFALPSSGLSEKSKRSINSKNNHDIGDIQVIGVKVWSDGGMEFWSIGKPYGSIPYSFSFS
jgi:hypothetical protein